MGGKGLLTSPAPINEFGKAREGKEEHRAHDLSLHHLPIVSLGRQRLGFMMVQRFGFLDELMGEGRPPHSTSIKALHATISSSIE